MGLRLSEGLDLERFAAVSGMRPAGHIVDELVALGLLEHCNGSRLRASAAGRLVLNEVVLRLACSVQGADAKTQAGVNGN
jgi:oxygen-independent coproporphyrinogen-3 oxidase